MEKLKDSQIAGDNETAEIKVYTKRWFLLGLFMLYTGNVALSWMQFASITNIVARYYNVPRALVEWTSIVNMMARAFLLVPFLFLMDKLVSRCFGILYAAWNLLLKLKADLILHFFTGYQEDSDSRKYFVLDRVLYKVFISRTKQILLGNGWTDIFGALSGFHVQSHWPILSCMV